MINIKSFQCEVETTAKYRIEFDETIMNKEWMDDFSKYFFNVVDTLEDHAEYLSEQISKFGIDTFIEGYGYPRAMYYNRKGNLCEYKRFGVLDSEINNAITVYMEDEDIGVYVINLE